MKEEHFRIHHLGIAVADIEKALAFYQSAFGFALVSQTFEDPIQKVKVCFLTNHQKNSYTVELISPLESTSPVNGFLSKGIGAYHICYEVKDLEKTLENVLANGCKLLSPPVPAVAFNSRRIAWCWTPTRHLVEFLELEQ